MASVAQAREDNHPAGWLDDCETTLASPEQGKPEQAPPKSVAPLDLPPIPDELVLQPGSFTVSTFSFVMMIFFVVLMVLTMALSGLIAGMGLGLAMLSMLL